jgi:hypothetical protein
MFRCYTLLSFALCSITISLFGQIVINSTDLSTTGDSYTWAWNDTATFNVGSGGGGQTWVFTWNNFEIHYRSEFISPQERPSGNQFPTATRTIRSYIPGDTAQDSYLYERVAADGVYDLGGEYGGAINVYPRESLVLRLPLQYQLRWTSVGYDSLEVFPGVYTVWVDSTISRVNGWGTVQTPYGSFPCLRVFEDVFINTYVGGELVSINESLSYEWLNQAGNFVVQVFAPQGVLDPNFESGFLVMSGVPLTSNPRYNASRLTHSMCQNYPNPFNAVTTIEYILPQPADVQLDIYNAVGQKITTLVNESQSRGSHRITWDGKNCATGMYIYQLKAGNVTDAKKMMLIK